MVQLKIEFNNCVTSSNCGYIRLIGDKEASADPVEVSVYVKITDPTGEEIRPAQALSNADVIFTGDAVQSLSANLVKIPLLDNGGYLEGVYQVQIILLNTTVTSDTETLTFNYNYCPSMDGSTTITPKLTAQVDCTKLNVKLIDETDYGTLVPNRTMTLSPPSIPNSGLSVISTDSQSLTGLLTWDNVTYMGTLNSNYTKDEDISSQPAYGGNQATSFLTTENTVTFSEANEIMVQQEIKIACSVE